MCTNILHSLKIIPTKSNEKSNSENDFLAPPMSAEERKNALYTFSGFFGKDSIVPNMISNTTTSNELVFF